MPLEDAVDVCVMLAATGRAVDPSKWIDGLVEEQEIAALGRLSSWGG